MTQEEIVALHDEIFAFLFEKYLEARAKGEEFYFIVNETGSPDFLAILFWDIKGISYSGNEAIIDMSILINIHTSAVYLYGNQKMNYFQLQEDDNLGEIFDKDIQRQSNAYENIGKIILGEIFQKTLPYSSIVEANHSEKNIQPYVEENAIQKYDLYSDIIGNLSDFLNKDKSLVDKYLKANDYNCFWAGSYFAKYVSHVRQSQADRKKKPFVAGLPFCLRSISIKNYKAIQQLEIEDIPSTTRWIFLTGENGIGKTLVLEAIALGLQEAYWLESNAERDKCIIETQYQTNLLEVNCSLNQQSIPNNYIMPHNNIPVVAYNCNRLSEIENKSGIGIAHLFEKTSLIDIDKWLTMLLKKIDSAESDKLQGLIIDEVQITKDKNIFQTLLITFQKILPISDIVLHPEKESVLYNEQNENGEVISSVPFSELSAGYKTLLCIISDMIVRLSSQKIPQNITPYSAMQLLQEFASDYSTQNNNEYIIKSPEELMGVAIIDEFENHLHAKFQRKLVEVLTDLFPKVQFIVSTHSPIPLLGAPEESVILHVERSKEEGITVERIFIENMENLQPNLLLTSPIFGLQDIFNIENKNLADIETEDNYETMLQNEARRKRLKERFLANGNS